MKKIVLDAMGGDFAPANEVAGALLALQEHPGNFEVILVGDEARLRIELKKRGAESLPLSVVHAAEVITMHDPPTAAVKAKKNSSIAVGMTMHKEGKADAFASAGNTGVMLSASTWFRLGDCEDRHSRDQKRFGGVASPPPARQEADRAGLSAHGVRHVLGTHRQVGQ